MSETDSAEPAFESILTRLQEVVGELERGDLPLERSLALFEEGVRLARLGSTRLDLAEARVEELLSASGSVATRPTEARAPEPLRGSEAIKTRPLETLDARPEPKQRDPR